MDDIVFEIAQPIDYKQLGNENYKNNEFTEALPAYDQSLKNESPVLNQLLCNISFCLFRLNQLEDMIA
jgi:hypothetical protein